MGNRSWYRTRVRVSRGYLAFRTDSATLISTMKADMRANSSNQTPSPVSRRLVAALQALAARQSKRNPAVERTLLGVATVAFAIITTLGILNFPAIPGDGINWLPLVVLVAGVVPATVAWNALEYGFSARVLGLHVPMRESLRISVLSSAANLLPVPGAAMVRSRALNQLGERYGRAVGSTALVGLAWLATTLAITGAVILAAGHTLFGSLSLAAGLVGLAAMAVWIPTGFKIDRTGRLVTILIAIESGFVILMGARMWLILSALGFERLDAAMALSLVAVVSTASGFFPGGLGLREALAGAVGPVVGLPATVGIVAAAADRTAGAVGLVLIGAALLRSKRSPVRPTGEHHAEWNQSSD